jgi:hypothetical protein
MRRQVDTLIVTAATGDAIDGDGNPVSWPPGSGLPGENNKIDNSGTKITFDMITQVQELFMQSTIDPDVPKVAVVGPSQVRALMQLTQQTSSDYVHRESLQTLNATGIVANWMGFTWILSTLLGIPTAGNTSCLFYTEKALGMQTNRDITVRVAEDPGVSFAWRVYTYMTMGAVRVQDEQIVELIVAN